MNNTDFTIQGGFPLEQDRLAFLQKSYLQGFEALAKFISPGLVVLSGCSVTGTTMGSGFIIFNGEILPFIGGAIQPTFIIRDESEPVAGLVYENAINGVQTHFPQRKRYAEFGVGATAIAWNPTRLPLPIADLLYSLPTTYVLIAQESWQQAAGLSANITQTALNPIVFKKTQIGEVHICGEFTITQALSGNPSYLDLFILPLNYRPGRVIKKVCASTATYYQNSSAPQTAKITIFTNGLVAVYIHDMYIPQPIINLELSFLI